MKRKEIPAGYMTPIIPQGYIYVCGERNTGFVIERATDGSQFVWIPVWCLKQNGIFNVNHPLEKFGRRYTKTDGFSYQKKHQIVDCEDGLEAQLASVNKYGGFYISRFNISKSECGQPQSLKGFFPWTDINFAEAQKVALSFEKNDAIKSHLTYGAEYDTIIEWIIESGARSEFSVFIDSREWGNFLRAQNSPQSLTRTGSDEKYCVNNIYDLAGNVCEMTQENYQEEQGMCILRGGCFSDTKNQSNVVLRRPARKDVVYDATGFRIVLLIK